MGMYALRLSRERPNLTNFFCSMRTEPRARRKRDSALADGRGKDGETREDGRTVIRAVVDDVLAEDGSGKVLSRANRRQDSQ
jgi:hypothetical protein